MKLFRSQIKLLSKVATRMAYSQKMDGTAVILTPDNKKRLEDAEQHVYDAIKLLRQII